MLEQIPIYGVDTNNQLMFDFNKRALYIGSNFDHKIMCYDNKIWIGTHSSGIYKLIYKINSISICKDNTSYKIIDDCLIYNDEFIVLYFGKNKKIQIPEDKNITTICSHAYSDISNNYLLIPDNIKTIEKYSFCGSNNIKRVLITSENCKIDKNAFIGNINIMAFSHFSNSAYDYASEISNNKNNMTSVQILTHVDRYGKIIN